MKDRIAKDITTVIFDLGGVLFDIEYKRTQEAFQKLGAITDFQEVYSQQKQAGIFDEFEKGNISPVKFREGLRKWLPEKVTDEQIDSAWNALLIGFPSERISMLARLKNRYNLFLLSNTNEIHLVEVMNMLKIHTPEGLDKVFTKEYYSCRMGLRKPDKEIYEKVLAENKLNPANTLFVDDLAQNIEGAQWTWLQILHCAPGTNLDEYFRED
jgi:glucose-1-phosphatase